MIKVKKVQREVNNSDGTSFADYPNAQLPKASHPGTSLAWDMYYAEDHEWNIHPGGIATLPTGIAIEIDTPMKIGLLLRERSSQGKKGIKVLGGVIDPDYRGEIKVMLVNLGKEIYKVSPGDRICQMIAMPTLTGLPVEWVDELSDTSRGEGGFGSTGV